VSESYDKLEKTNSEHHERAESLQVELDLIKIQLSEAQASGNTQEVELLKESLKEAEKDLKNQADRIDELEQQINERPIETSAATVIEKVPEAVENELIELRKSKQNGATAIFKVYFDELVKNFQSLLGSLAGIKTADQEEYERYKNVVQQLIGKMAERL
jgi:predicted RNase H-like nuclease (RuvC/YqgF family)